MPDTYNIQGMGWLPDYPDHRDFTADQASVTQKLVTRGQSEPVAAILSRTIMPKARSSLPPSVDLRACFSPIEDQGALGSCTAHAGVALVEYFERKAFGKHIDASRLFLYKVTRNLLRMTGDSGAFLRSTMSALVLFGVPPEEYFPYDTAELNTEPPAFCYAFAQDYQTIQYYRLDPPNTLRDALLKRIKDQLATGLPCMFGFPVFRSCRTQARHNGGKFPMPSAADAILGGHAVVAAGYDDDLEISNTDDGGLRTTGAILIRNSWSDRWGTGGYGWIPYEYVASGLAEDWWSLVKSEWVDTGAFGDLPPLHTG